jgi:hypothetical protein
MSESITPTPPSAPPSCRPSPRCHILATQAAPSDGAKELSSNEKVDAIRSWMSTANLQAFLIGSEDAHQVCGIVYEWFMQHRCNSVCEMSLCSIDVFQYVK